MTSCKAEGEQYTYGEDLEPQIPEIIQTYKTGGYNTNQAYMAVGSRWVSRTSPIAWCLVRAPEAIFCVSNELQTNCKIGNSYLVGIYYA
jgi:hypothetical protein